MSLFTPVTGFLGGSLIGLAADALLLFNGDILGASGIVSSVVLNPLQTVRDSKQHWKLVFLSSFLTTASLILGPPTTPESSSTSSDGSSSTIRTLSTLGLAVAGLLVGFGTNLGNGCTSGHGICGLARLSKRSMAAVVSFMITGIATSTWLETHTDSVVYRAITTSTSRDGGSSSDAVYDRSIGLYVGAALALLSVLAPLVRRKAYNASSSSWIKKVPAAAAAGSLFATGLRISQMVVQTKVLGFLTLLGTKHPVHWDPTLITVMGGGLLVSTLGYQHVDTTHLHGKYVVPGRAVLKRPIVCGDDSTYTYDSCLPSNQLIDGRLLLGSAVFGMGWGLAGYCPGPALYLAGAGDVSMVSHWWPTFVIGSFVASHIKQRFGGDQCQPGSTITKSKSS